MALLALTGLIVAVFVLASLARPRYALLIVSAMLFVSTLGVAGERGKLLIELWLGPLQRQRSEVYLGMGLGLFLPLLMLITRSRVRTLPLQSLLMVIIGFYAGTMRFIHEGPRSGAESLLFIGVTGVPLLLILPRLLEEWDDWYRMLRAVMWMNLAWVGAVAIQFFVNRSPLLIGGERRFTGLSNNPQLAATLLAALSVIAVWMILNDPLRRFRPLWIGVASLDIVMLVLTGSRTGAGMFMIGIVAVLYSRAGQAIFLVPPAGLIAAVVLDLLRGMRFGGGFERFTSTENTRAEPWKILWDKGMESPLVGVGVDEALFAENSYLLGFASYGVGMVFLLLILVLVSGAIMMRLGLLRWRAPKAQRALIDLILGFNAMLFLGGIFEGYLVARVAPQVVLLYMFGAMTARLIAKMTREDPAYVEEAVAEDEAEDVLEHAGYGDAPPSGGQLARG